MSPAQKTRGAYEGYFVLTITYLPPLLNERKFIELMFEDDVRVTQ